jgi:hypothetical protein
VFGYPEVLIQYLANGGERIAVGVGDGFERLILLGRVKERERGFR